MLKNLFHEIDYTRRLGLYAKVGTLLTIGLCEMVKNCPSSECTQNEPEEAVRA